VQLADLVLAARMTVKGEFASDETAHAALQQLIQVGTSAGGARAKAVVAFNPSTYQVRSAYGPPADDFEQWLIKLDGVSATGTNRRGDDLGESAPYGRIEYAYNQMAVRAGVEMTPCLLLPEGPRRHFMTRRFDRGPQGQRHHVVSLCALAHLDYNLVGLHGYDQYFQTVKALGLDSEQLREAFRRMIFNVMAVNRDDHTKNFAFMRPDGNGWRLAPAFDITHAYRPDSQWNSRHLMSINGKFEDITLNDIHAVGERADVPGYRKIVRQVEQAVASWPDFAAEAELSEDMVKTIAAQHERCRPR
jgi:serine/threonine-protein kinase HipA